MAARQPLLRRRFVLGLPVLVVSLLQVSVGGAERSVSGGVAPVSAGAGTDQTINVCCAWGRQLADGNLTVAFTGGDAATIGVMRRAVAAWAAALPELTLTEVGAEQRPDIALAYGGPSNTTHGLAVTSFDRAGLTRKVQITVHWRGGVDDVSALDQITKHEFGHALGVGHSEFEGDLMSPTVNPDPAPIPVCNVRAAREANRWKFLDRARDPRRPSERAVSCGPGAP